MGAAVAVRRFARTVGSARVLYLAGVLAADALLMLSRPRGAFRMHERLWRDHGARLSTREIVHFGVRRLQAMSPDFAAARGDALARELRALIEPPELHDLRARALFAVASWEFRCDRPRTALRDYRSLERDPAADRLDGIARALNLANALTGVGRLRGAARHFTLAREGASTATDATGRLANIDQNEAYSAMRAGELGRALALFDRALVATVAVESTFSFAALCLDRAELFLMLSMPREARAELARMRGRIAKLSEQDAAHADYVEAVAAHAGGDAERAVGLFHDVAATFTDLGFAERAAQCRVLEARALLACGRVAAARARVAGALEGMARRTDPRRVAAQLLAAEIHVAAGDLPAARVALGIATARGDARLPAWMRIEGARVEALVAGACGAPAERRAALLRAADILDGYVGRLPIDEYLVPFLSARSWLHEALASELLEDGCVAEAFVAVERGRARALLELLGGTDGGDASLAELRLSRLERQLSAAQFAVHEAATRPVRPDERVVRARDELAAHTAARVDRAVAAAPRARPWEGLAARLPRDTTLVEYVWLGGRLHAFVVRAGTVRHVRLAADAGALRRTLELAAFQFRTARTRPAAAAQSELSRRSLERHLDRAREAVWTPLDGLVPSGRVVVVAAEGLHVLPFHALSGRAPDGRPRRVVHAPSATAYLASRRGRASDGSCAVFALPDAMAPQIGDEAQDIAAIWPGTELRLDRAATLDAFGAAAARARVLHVCTHGRFQPGAPLLSAFRLHDRWVNAYDVYGLHVAADLVVLAACETAGLVASRDEDRLGLVRAFLVAGAGAVLAPQWPVGDDAARAYVRALFGALRSGRTAAEAADDAASAVRSAFPHPADWAGWFLYDRAPAA